jgi:hypothetical protein
MRGIRISFPIWLLAVLPVAVVAGWAGWWYLESTILQRALDSWVATERAQGSEIHFVGPRVGGFPWRLRAIFTDVTITRPDGLAWQGQGLKVDARLWRIHAMHLRLLGHQDVRLPARLMPPVAASAVASETITVDGAEGWLTLGGAQGFTEARLVLSDLGLPSATVARLDVGASAPAVAVTADTDVGLSVSVTADGIRVPGAVAPSLGPAIESATVIARVMGAPPRLEPDALLAWSREGGTLALETASLHWGPLVLGAEGTLGLDRNLQPIGALTAEVTGFEQAIDGLVDAGWLKPKNALTAKAALAGLVPAPQDGRPPASSTVKVPLSLHDRFVHIGPFRLVPLPPLVWPRPAAG